MLKESVGSAKTRLHNQYFAETVNRVFILAVREVRCAAARKTSIMKIQHPSCARGSVCCGEKDIDYEDPTDFKIDNFLNKENIKDY
ncbi:hypothetical protein QE152_g15336 [Popillia japonica]|uniref:Uncharacterized protein n=1 Tax=Popillia japonica TaxID=7064 RepID=A0AAW1L5Y0_POPJA